jgi:ketosteroid isomerase-like protein
MAAPVSKVKPGSGPTAKSGIRIAKPQKAHFGDRPLGPPWQACSTGWQKTSRTVLRIDLDVSAAGLSGDLGYVVGSEHSKASIGGEAAAPIALRVTLIFRREDGEWKEVHRYADPIPGIQSTQDQLGRFK